MALAVALSGCGKGKSPGGAKADSANPGAEATASVVSNKLAAIAAAGEPVTLEELNQWYAEPPEGQNAARVYTRAFDALTGTPKTDEAKSPAFLARNQKALALLLQAAELKSCRYPVALEEGASAKLPHLSKIKTCAWLLQGEAINQASHSRTDASTKALLAGVSLARSVQNEPLLISFLVENSCLSIMFQGLEQALTHRAFTEDQLLSLQAALQDAESYASSRRALVGERAEVISHFQMSPEEWAKAWTEAGTNVSQSVYEK